MLIFACVLGWLLVLLLSFVWVAAVKEQAKHHLALETFLAILLLDPLAYQSESMGLRQSIAEEDNIPREKLPMATYYFLMSRALSYQPESFQRAVDLISDTFDESNA